jgi:predicted secreted protein
MADVLMAHINISDTEAGKTLAVVVGDSITIHLTENPTTGFRWFMGSSKPDFLVLEDDSFSPPNSSEIGAGGIRSMRFRVTGSGRGKFSLKSYREWEGEETSVRNFDLAIDSSR